MRQLARQRIGALHRDDVGLEGRGPGRLAVVRSQPHRRHAERSARAGERVAVLVGTMRVDRIFAARLLPAPRRRGGIRKHERRQCSARKPHHDRRRVFDDETPARRRRDRLHFDDFAAKHPQIVDFVDQVDEDRTPADLAAPRCLGKIAIGLAKRRAAAHRDETAEHTVVDDRLRRGEQRTVSAVMSDEDRHRLALGRDHQLSGAVEPVGDWLLDQHRHVARDARESVGDVRAVRRRDDHPIGAHRIEQRLHVRVPRNAERSRQTCRMWRGIGDGHERRRVARTRQLDVAAPDDTRAHHRYA